MRQMSRFGLTAAALATLSVAAVEPPQPQREAKPEDDEKTSRQRKRWLQKQARKKNRVNR